MLGSQKSATLSASMSQTTEREPGNQAVAYAGASEVVAVAERQAKEDRGQKVRGRKANPTDPESRILQSGGKFFQGYNAQAVANEEQVIPAAEITQENPHPPG